MKILKWQIYLTTFFILMLENIVTKLPKRLIHFVKQFVKDYYEKKRGLETYLHFSAVNKEKNDTLLNGLSAGKATGMDSLPASFMKEIIACTLSDIINVSLHSSQIPECMKMQGW